MKDNEKRDGERGTFMDSNKSNGEQEVFLLLQSWCLLLAVAGGFKRNLKTSRLSSLFCLVAKIFCRRKVVC